MRILKKILSLLLVCALGMALPACTIRQSSSYTLNIGLVGESMSWENSDTISNLLAELCSVGLTSTVCTENGETIARMELADSIEDITAEFADKERWNITETEGRVFRIYLRQDAVWEDGSAITAETFVQSLRWILKSSAHSAETEAYMDKATAPYGARAYYESETPVYASAVPHYGAGQEADYSYDRHETSSYLHLTTHDMTLSQHYSVYELMKCGYVDDQLYARLAEQANPYGYVLLTLENEADIYALAAEVLAFYGLNFSEDAFSEMLFYDTDEMHPACDFQDVGVYAESDWELVYITKECVSLVEFCDAMRLYRPLVSAIYGDEYDVPPSCGPYTIASVGEDGTLTLTRNESWYGYLDSERAREYPADSIRILYADSLQSALTLWRQGKIDIILSETPYFSPRITITANTDDPRNVWIRGITILYDDQQWARYLSLRGGFWEIPQT